MCRVDKDDQPGRSSAEPIKGEERWGFYRGCCIEVGSIMSWGGVEKRLAQDLLLPPRLPSATGG